MGDCDKLCGGVRYCWSLPKLPASLTAFRGFSEGVYIVSLLRSIWLCEICVYVLGAELLQDLCIRLSVFTLG